MDILESEVLEFIESFKQNDREIELFFLTGGNSYYFAIILQERFNHCGLIMYNPDIHQFYYKIIGNMYYICGKVLDEEKIKVSEPWSIYKNKDIKEEAEIIANDIMKIPEEKINKIIP